MKARMASTRPTRAEGKAASEAASRVWKQYAGDAIYRFASEDLFVAARFANLRANVDDVPWKRNV